MSTDPIPGGWESRFHSVELSIFGMADVYVEDIDEGEMARLTMARQTVLRLMRERRISSDDVYWLSKDVWGGRGWWLFEVLDPTDLGGMESWRLDAATGFLLDLEDELQWPFWMMQDPKLARHERRCVFRRFGTIERAAAVVRISQYVHDLTIKGIRHNDRPKTAWEFWNRPQPDEELPKPIGNRVFPTIVRLYESERGGRGRQKTKDRPTIVTYSDGTRDFAHLFHYE